MQHCTGTSVLLWNILKVSTKGVFCIWRECKSSISSWALLLWINIFATLLGHKLEDSVWRGNLLGNRGHQLPKNCVCSVVLGRTAIWRRFDAFLFMVLIIAKFQRISIKFQITPAFLQFVPVASSMLLQVFCCQVFPATKTLWLPLSAPISPQQHCKGHFDVPRCPAAVAAVATDRWYHGRWCHAGWTDVVVENGDEPRSHQGELHLGALSVPGRGFANPSDLDKAVNKRMSKQRESAYKSHHNRKTWSWVSWGWGISRCFNAKNLPKD